MTNNIFSQFIDEPEPEKEKTTKKTKQTQKGKNNGKSGTDNSNTIKKNNKRSEKTKKESPKVTKGISEETKEKALSIIDQEKNIQNEKFADYMDSDDVDLPDLTKESYKAQLMKHINDEKLQKYKIEQEKMKMMKAAGDIQERSFAEFLYYGYMEKCNLDFLSMMKKLKPKLDALVKEKDTAGVIKLINKEIKNTLTTIKKNQKKDVKEWERTL